MLEHFPAILERNQCILEQKVGCAKHAQPTIIFVTSRNS